MSFPDSDNPDKFYNDLAARWLDGTITPEEEQLFNEWYNRSQDDQVIIPHEFAADRQELRTRMLKDIKSKIDSPRRISILYRYLAGVAAAVMIIAAGFGAYHYFSPAPNERMVKHIEREKPGLSKQAKDTMVVLTLADGTDLLLDQAADGQLIRQGNARVVKMNNRRLVYSPVEGDGGGQVFYNAVRTPKGGQYQVVLPDNSVVWLNASSSLRFPTVFSGAERIVELTGEGYFEVSKNRQRPFKVQVNGMEVRVLGTHFNIMAYREEGVVNTTLLEGAVKVRNADASLLIRPGQQAVLAGDSKKLTLNRKVNIEQVMAWKEGEFRFENTRLETIMRQVARWYDIDVVYDKGLKEIGLTGSISRSNTVAQLLEILEATRRIRFEQSGHRIRVLEGTAR